MTLHPFAMAVLEAYPRPIKRSETHKLANRWLVWLLNQHLKRTHV